MSRFLRALTLTAALLCGAVQGEMISTQESLNGRPLDPVTVEQARGDREHLRAVLMADGIAADQAVLRVQALTDAEVRRLASLMHLEPVGEGR